jgi:hypothetical protein
MSKQHYQRPTGVFHLLKKWPLWIGVALMMLAMIAYVLTLDESEAPVSPDAFPEQFPAEAPAAP